jgi:hypothetical protein
MHTATSDLSAKLLATENLTVVRATTRTASFDIRSRVLTLPLWKDMTPEIEDMLIAHEVGHALYTGEKYIEPIEKNPRIMTYLNVLEDVRIEKLIKRKYPGLRKRMSVGYKQLNDRDFFKVKQVQSFDKLLLIDKINMYYKAGFDCGVKFNSIEREFVDRAERCETVEEVIELAHEIYEFSKDQIKQQKEQRQQNSSKSSIPEDQEEEDDDQDDPSQTFGYSEDQEEDDQEDEAPASNDSDDSDTEQDSDDQQQPNGKPSGEQEETETPAEANQDTTEDELESLTDKAFSQQLESLADDSTHYFYWKYDTHYQEDPVISYKTILNEIKKTWTIDDMPYRNSWYQQMVTRQKEIDADFEKFKSESVRTVNYLVKEFDMRKSAQMYKRAQTSKVGSLDMRKIWSYKLNDDLFKRVTVLPTGKNHGMIFLLDWSGSMSNVITETLQQVINLAMFCSKVQIPYRVLAFTSQYHLKTIDRYGYKSPSPSVSKDRDTLKTNDNFRLLELFSDKMTSSEFNTMAKRTLDPKFFLNEGYDLGATPLNQALVWVYNNLGTYIKNNNIEKMTFITLTDGEGGSISPYVGSRAGLQSYSNEYINGQYKRITQKHFIRDEQTQKTYEFSSDSSKQTEVILRMIKDRYGVAVVGFYISKNSLRDLRSVIRCNIPDFRGDYEALIEDWRKDFKNDGFASISGTGRDDLFLIPQSSTKIDDGELEATSNMSASAISRKFSNYLNVKKTSRVLLNRFIGYVA